MKSIFMIALLTVAVSPLASGQTQDKKVGSNTAVEQAVLKAEREQRDAYLRRDVAATERLVAPEFVLTIQGGEIGSKATLITFLKEEPADPTLTLTADNTQVRVNGDTAIVIGRRIERRRRPDNNREGVAYARYTRTYVKREGRWQLLAEHLQAIPAERTAIKVDTNIYEDYLGHYDSPIFAFNVVKEGDRLVAIPDEKERPRAELLPESESEFFLQGRDAQITFMRDRRGQVTHALLHINGVDIRAKRIG